MMMLLLLLLLVVLNKSRRGRNLQVLDFVEPAYPEVGMGKQHGGIFVKIKQDVTYH